MSGSRVDLLLRSFDQAFDARAWHGTNLRGSLRGVSAEEAAFRPAPGRHNIWELALHCAYWKYAVRRRITGEKRGSFPLRGSDFFARPEGAPEAGAWRADVRLLDACHADLRRVFEGLSERDLARTPPGSRVATLDVALGIAAHDLYHAGQIQLLKRLARGGPRRRH